VREHPGADGENTDAGKPPERSRDWRACRFDAHRAWTGQTTADAADAFTGGAQRLIYETLFPLQYTLYRFGDQHVAFAGEYWCFGVPIPGNFYPFANEPEGGDALGGPPPRTRSAEHARSLTTAAPTRRSPNVVKHHPGPAAMQAASTATSAATHIAAATRHQILSELRECCFVSANMVLSSLDAGNRIWRC
jgi:hypothetical protein